MSLEKRKQDRCREQSLVQLIAVRDPQLAEMATLEDVSSCGSRLATERFWEPGLHVELKSPTGDLWGRARVVYCQSLGPNAFAVGLNLLTQTSDWEERKSFVELGHGKQHVSSSLSQPFLVRPALAEKLDEALAARVGFEEVVDAAVALMRSDYSSLQMLYPGRGTGGELRLLAFRGFNPQAARFWEWVRADSKSTCGIALRDAQRVVAPDIATCDFMADSEDQQVYLQTGIRACQTTPLIARGGNVVGMISTHWRRPHQPTEQDFRQFDTLAKQAGDLIERCTGGEELVCLPHK